MLRDALGQAMDLVGSVISAIGVAVIVGGMLLATWRCLRTPGPEGRYVAYRHDIGRAILLGLEFLVAADIIETVGAAPTLDNVVVLAGIVLIRTLLSVALQVELEGQWPWQRHKAREPER